MNRPDVRSRFFRLLRRLAEKDLPLSAVIANETGAPPGSAGVLPYPRFSFCLSGTARYHITREQQSQVVELRRGAAIFVPPGCLMEPHSGSRYLSLGVVFTPEMTRFLLARKDARGHRFLLAHHSPALADEETLQLCQMLGKTSARTVDDSFLLKLFQLLLIKSRELTEREAPVSSSRKAWFTWQSACQYMQENFSQPIGRAEVAAFLNLHPNHLSRLFTRCGSVSFNHHLLGIRLRHAKQMLADPALNIGDIATACGFTDTNYFVRCFRKETGIPPVRWRSSATVKKSRDSPEGA